MQKRAPSLVESYSSIEKDNNFAYNNWQEGLGHGVRSLSTIKAEAKHDLGIANDFIIGIQVGGSRMEDTSQFFKRYNSTDFMQSGISNLEPSDFEMGKPLHSVLEERLAVIENEDRIVREMFPELSDKGVKDMIAYATKERDIHQSVDDFENGLKEIAKERKFETQRDLEPTFYDNVMGFMSWMRP